VFVKLSYGFVYHKQSPSIEHTSNPAKYVCVSHKTPLTPYLMPCDLIINMSHTLLQPFSSSHVLANTDLACFKGSSPSEQLLLRSVDVDGSADSVHTSLHSVQLTAKRPHFPLKLLDQAEQIVHITSRDLVTVVILVSVISPRQLVIRVVVLAVVGIRSDRSRAITVHAASFPLCH
jgi:hypothetical protein